VKIHNVEQGSGEWLQIRLGIPTASMFHKIITPAKLEYSKQARAYAFYLVAEKLLNMSLSPLEKTEWMERGNELEPQAIRAYEFQEETETAPVGFITDDAMTMGATPDRLLVGASAGLEIKCPAPHTHLAYLIDGFGSDYVAQAQGQNLVGEFEFVDRYSWHPELPPCRVRTYRNEAFISALQSAIDRFNEEKHEIEERVRAMGYFEDRKRLLTAVDELAAQEDR
jgi:hypothetical protein